MFELIDGLVSLDIGNVLTLIATPFGLATLGVILTAFLVEKTTKKGWKIFVSWAVGIFLTVGVFFLGKYASVGMFTGFIFETWKHWATFVFLALSPGMISNGIYDTKILEPVLKWLGKYN